MLNCVVTGATGYIGRALCSALRREGHNVRAWSRGGGGVCDGLEARALDLLQQRLQASQLAGADVVYHLGGIAHRRAPPAHYHRVNYEAAAELGRSAAAAGVKRFVFLSSVRAMGPPAGAAARGEADCAPPGSDPYGRAKRAAEQALVETCAGGPMALVILRPVPVYGPGAAGNLATFLQAVRRGLPRPPPRGARQFLHRDDLVTLLAALAQRELPAAGNTWIVAEPQPCPLQLIHDRARAALGRSPGTQWAPLWLWRTAATARDMAAGTAGLSTFDRLFGTELYDIRRVRQDCDWRPVHRLSDELGTLMDSGGSVIP